MAGLLACPANACAEVKRQVQSSGGYVAKGEASKGVVEALEALSLIRKNREVDRKRLARRVEGKVVEIKKLDEG